MFILRSPSTDSILIIATPKDLIAVGPDISNPRGPLSDASLQAKYVMNAFNYRFGKKKFHEIPTGRMSISLGLSFGCQKL